MEDLIKYIPEDKRPLFKDLEKEYQSIITGQYNFAAASPKELKGRRMPPLMEPETVQKACDTNFPEGTVFLATFPKTGTNWMYEIVRNILFGEDKELLAVSKIAPFVLFSMHIWKAAKYDFLKYLPLPRRILATHLPEELMEVEKIAQNGGKIIMVVRNPKDQAVSWFHFSKNKWFDSIRDELSADWPQFFSDYIQGKHPLFTRPGEWYVDYLAGWSKHKGSSRVLFVCFEQMKKNPLSEIRRIADFLEVSLTDERATSVLNATTFDAMKQEQSTESSGLQKFRNSLNLIRKGKVGSWKEYFTVAQSEMMDKIIEEKLGQCDIPLIFE